MSPSARRVIEDGFAKPTEAARFLGVGKTWVYELIRNGTLSHIRQGRRVSIPWIALREYAEALLQYGHK